MNGRKKSYFDNLKVLIDKIIVTDAAGKIYKFNAAIEMCIGIILNQAKLCGKLMFIGNGASAAISSHMATDFWKTAGIPALAFNDSSLLTCISNDYGYKHVFEKPVEMFAQQEDILFAISSSGKSENVLRAVKVAKNKKLKVVTLSGFSKNNPLRKLGDINFYVPAWQYGLVEPLHHSICHCLVDSICKKKYG